MSQNLITAADAILTLSIASLYPSGVTVQGFASDDAFNIPDVDITESMMGVDGVLSAGWVPVPFTQEISLQADSDSNQVFENWYLNQRQLRTILWANGGITVPSTRRQYTLQHGVIKGYSPAPQAKKVLQPRRYSIVWNAVLPASYGGL